MRLGGRSGKEVVGMLCYALACGLCEGQNDSIPTALCNTL